MFQEIPRELLWKILKKVCISPLLIQMIRALYDDSIAELKIDVITVDGVIDILSSLKQGCN